jgi:phosphoribosylglycinamide formyltransferase-1
VSRPLRVVVLISGRGTNLTAILDAIEQGQCAARVVGILSDKRKAEGLAHGETRNIPTTVVRPKDHPDRDAWDRALADAIGAHDPELIVLAGFMRIVGAPIIDRFAPRIINVHPSLLPSFPGAHGAADAIAAGVRLSGCTVHVVDSGLDSGPIIAQAAVHVLPNDTPAALQARIQTAEHRLLPRVIDAVARGAVQLGPPLVVDAKGDGGTQLFSLPFAQP